MARAWTEPLLRPLLTGCQFAPPSLLFKTPVAEVPVYRIEGVVGWIARAWTSILLKPLLRAVQWAPPSRLLKTPASAVAA